MRTLDEHKVNPANDQLTIEVVDAPGAGGASHLYHVYSPDYVVEQAILFQNGPIAEVGVNGLTHEVLLAILADRLRAFQAGPYACRENGDALNHVEWALGNLKARTLNRMTRGVEGTHTV